MKNIATLVVAFAAMMTLSAGLQAATPAPAHHSATVRIAKHTAKPLAAKGAKINTAQSPACCAGVSCCASGDCCSMPNCCKAGGACCDPAKGTCTSACGCLSMTCCH